MPHEMPPHGPTAPAVYETLPARVALNAWMGSHERRLARRALIAEVTGVVYQAVDAWADGRTRPDSDGLREVVELLTARAVKAVHWRTTREVEDIDRRKALARAFARNLALQLSAAA